MRLFFLAALAACAASVSAAEPASDPVAFNTWARVTLDAAGHPLSIEPSPDLPEAVRDVIGDRVARWHFTPPGRNGVTGGAITYVQLGACALPDASGGYRLGVDLKGNGPRYAVAPVMLVPAYPRHEMRRGGEAKMVVSYVVERDGSTTFEGVDFTDGRSHRRDSFADVARLWVQGMRYEPEFLAGDAVRTRITVSLEFSLTPGRGKHVEQGLDSAECRLAAGQGPATLQPLAMDSPVKIEPRG